MYTADDFNIENAPKEMVQYVIDNVDDFEHRYQHALSIIGRNRCPLVIADICLYEEIRDMVNEWCYQENFWPDDYHVEEIFG